MNTDIRYIFLDLGNTFRIADQDKEWLEAAKAKVAELCGIKTEDPCRWFDDVIDKRYALYRNWALKYMCEAPEEVLWCRWLAYDCNPALIKKNASELTFQYRQTKGHRRVVDGGAETVKELCKRGYTMGIISDLVGRKEVDMWLDEDGLRPYFKVVEQSSIRYIRKPHPALYYYALEAVGAQPENCCFVGDNLNRDIVGAKACEFGMTVAVHYQAEKPLELTAENMPDCEIRAFPQLLDYFPAVGQVAVDHLIRPGK